MFVRLGGSADASVKVCERAAVRRNRWVVLDERREQRFELIETALRGLDRNQLNEVVLQREGLVEAGERVDCVDRSRLGVGPSSLEQGAERLPQEYVVADLGVRRTPCGGACLFDDCAEGCDVSVAQRILRTNAERTAPAQDRAPPVGDVERAELGDRFATLHDRVWTIQEEGSNAERVGQQPRVASGTGQSQRLSRVRDVRLVRCV